MFVRLCPVLLKISPKTAAPWAILLDNLHLALLHCPQIITPGQLMPRAMTITTYNFSMAIFSFFSMDQLYNFCYGNKNNNDNSNKAWSLKLLNIIIL